MGKKISRQKKHKQVVDNELSRDLGPTWQLVCALLLFFMSVLASRGADMLPWEIDLFSSLYNTPEFLRPIVFIFTQAGSLHMLGLLLLVALIGKNYSLFTRLLMTSSIAFLASGVAKDMWGRLRPHELITGVSNLDYVVRGPGFPSGHTALAVAMALVINDYLPKQYRWLTWLWIIGVGYSRLYLGIHAPLDVLGGFAIGWMSYALIKHVKISNIIGVNNGN